MCQSVRDRFKDFWNDLEDAVAKTKQAALYILKGIFKCAFQHVKELDLMLHNRNPPAVLFEKQQESKQTLASYYDPVVFMQ